jgi:hypothetical protein
MADDAIVFTPTFQQADRVHAVLSGLDDCFPTTIRSDGSMHVDPLTDCIPSIHVRNSRGYVSYRMERTRDR